MKLASSSPEEVRCRKVSASRWRRKKKRRQTAPSGEQKSGTGVSIVGGGEAQEGLGEPLAKPLGKGRHVLCEALDEHVERLHQLVAPHLLRSLLN
jgi:hypothetical protein